jgi:hypothetical protein
VDVLPNDTGNGAPGGEAHNNDLFTFHFWELAKWNRGDLESRDFRRRGFYPQIAPISLIFRGKKEVTPRAHGVAGGIAPLV